MKTLFRLFIRLAAPLSAAMLTGCATPGYMDGYIGQEARSLMSFSAEMRLGQHTGNMLLADGRNIIRFRQQTSDQNDSLSTSIGDKDFEYTQRDRVEYSYQYNYFLTDQAGTILDWAQGELTLTGQCAPSIRYKDFEFDGGCDEQDPPLHLPLERLRTSHGTSAAQWLSSVAQPSAPPPIPGASCREAQEEIMIGDQLQPAYRTICR